jgi:MFS family permease
MVPKRQILVRPDRALTISRSASKVALLTTPAHSSPIQLRAADHLPQIDSLRRPLSEWLLLLMLAAVQFTVAVGRLADQFGRMRIFTIMMFCSIVAAFVSTHLPVVPAAVAVAASTFFMISMTGRFVPAMAIITSCVEQEHRGGFMSVNSAVAQFSGALAATAAASVIHDGANHQLVGFGKVAWLYVGWAVIGVWLASGVRSAAVPTAAAGEEKILQAEEIG